MSFDDPIQYNIRDYRRADSIFGAFDSERMQRPSFSEGGVHSGLRVFKETRSISSGFVLGTPVGKCAPLASYIFEITSQEECERASASRVEECTLAERSLQASRYTPAEGLCSGAGAKAPSSVSGGSAGPTWNAGHSGDRCALAKGLPVVDFGGPRVGDMAQAKCVGLMGNGRSQAEGCVPILRRQFLAFPGCFEFGHECTRFAGLRFSHLSGPDDKTTPDSQLSGHCHYPPTPPRLGIDVRRTAYRDCDVRRTLMPYKGHGSSHGDTPWSFNQLYHRVRTQSRFRLLGWSKKIPHGLDCWTGLGLYLLTTGIS
ncbi:hypothetical protein EDB83DRAFT_2548844 [Lactarius deliciosus]|nr:hypothetical protein EDB83DRAFT_2548844 [Lactarius deliciosus]